MLLLTMELPMPAPVTITPSALLCAITFPSKTLITPILLLLPETATPTLLAAAACAGSMPMKFCTTALLLPVTLMPALIAPVIDSPRIVEPRPLSTNVPGAMLSRPPSICTIGVEVNPGCVVPSMVTSLTTGGKSLVGVMTYGGAAMLNVIEQGAMQTPLCASSSA
jgi:hypothetical protein